MEDRFERFTFITTEIHQQISKLSSEVMAEYGLRGSQAIYLLTLEKHRAGITSAKLAELCCRNKADVSRAMVDFANAELITKKGDSKNYRATIFLTPKGAQYADKLRSKCNDVLSVVGIGIPEEKRVVLYECLEIISKNLREINEP